MRTVIFSDIHGFFKECKAVMRSIGIVDEEGHWTGKDTRLIVNGDLVDRGPQSVETYRFFRNLQDQLGQDQVEILLGNHDIQYFGGPEAGLDFKVVDEIRSDMQEDARKGNTKFATTIKSGDTEWLVVHGGLHPGHNLNDLGPAGAAQRINELGLEFAREGVQHPEIVGVGYQRCGDIRVQDAVFMELMASGLPEVEQIRLARMHPIAALRELEKINKDNQEHKMRLSVDYLARKGIYEAPGVTWCDVVDDLELNRDNILPQIIGHRQQRQGINLRCDGKAWAINVPYGDSQALVVEDNSITPSVHWQRNVGELVQPDIQSPDRDLSW